MSVVQESGIEFDFSSANQIRFHDRSIADGGEGNTIWKGVDFRVEISGKWIWIEVKSWNPRRITPRHRGGNQRRFVSRLKSKSFGLELRSKFFGTTAFLTWKGVFQPSNVVYIVILEPPRPLDKALLGTFMQQQLRTAFPQNGNWTHPISAVVVDINDWNNYYSEFPAVIL